MSGLLRSPYWTLCLWTFTWCEEVFDKVSFTWRQTLTCFFSLEASQLKKSWEEYMIMYLLTPFTTSLACPIAMVWGSKLNSAHSLMDIIFDQKNSSILFALIGIFFNPVAITQEGKQEFACLVVVKFNLPTVSEASRVGIYHQRLWMDHHSALLVLFLFLFGILASHVCPQTFCSYGNICRLL